jgi:hypothetical protein
MKLTELLHLAMHKYHYPHMVRKGIVHICGGPWSEKLKKTVAVTCSEA